MSRRPFLGVMAAAGLGFAARSGEAAAAFSLVEIAPGVFAHQGAQEDFSAANEGGIANLALILGKERAAVVDTGGCERQGLAFLSAIRQVTDLPIAYVVLTHAHPDHVFGNGAFLGEKPVFVGHARLPRAMADRGPAYLANMRAIMGDAVAGTQLVPPTRLIQTGAPETIDLGGRAIELRAWPTAHTDCDLSLRVPDAGLFIAGDLVTVQRLPVVDGSITSWLKVMPELAAEPATRVLPGHGPVSPWPLALTPVRAYLSWLRGQVAKLQDQGVQIDAIVEAVPLPAGATWLVAEDVHPRNVIAVYKELEWE